MEAVSTRVAAANVDVVERGLDGDVRVSPRAHRKVTCCVLPASTKVSREPCSNSAVVGVGEQVAGIGLLHATEVGDCRNGTPKLGSRQVTRTAPKGCIENTSSGGCQHL
jgi:hypothetical protein